MIPADQSSIRTHELARELGVCQSALYKRAAEFRSAKLMRGVYLVQRLRDLGVLPRLEQAREAKP